MKAWRGIAMAVVCGAVIWALSPRFTGKFEPWDAHGPYYWASLLSAGILIGLAEPKKALTSSLWVVAGQALYILSAVLFGGRDIGLLFPMGLFSLIILSTPCYVGAFLVAKFFK